MNDRELMERISRDKDFMRHLFLEDSLEDWNLAKDWGELAIRIDPEDLTHHFVVARACRHLGDKHRALTELGKCQALIRGGHMGPVEQEVIVPLVLEEERLLSLE